MTLAYNEAIDYLYSFINYELKRVERYTPDVVSLQRPRQLAEALGNPHLAYPTIHITGTKGKGSVGAMCASALQAAGLRTGLYTSPHLQDFRERFRINGQMIPVDTFTALVEEIQPAVAEAPGLTWFEIVTALGFLYFARERVDAAVIEVGLGGRLDATNIVAPLVSVITSLSYDHTYLLGETLGEIAGEKAGIIKPETPVVSAPQHAEALAVLETIAARNHAPLTLAGRDWTFQPLAVDDHIGQSFRAGPAGGPQRRYWTPLLGAHQVINGAVATAALDIVAQAGLPVTPEAVCEGLRRVDWPGRLELISKAPWLVLDAAHNAESAGRLRDALRDLFPHKRLFLIFGASSDKDIAGMFRELLPITHQLITVQAVHPRAMDPEELAGLARASGYAGRIEAIASVEAALARAQDLADADDLICATGSLFVVGEARDVCGLKPGHAVYMDAAPVCAGSPALTTGSS